MRWSAIAMLGALVLVGPASAQVILSDRHIDLGMGYSAGTGWDLHIHDETGAAEFSPGGAPGATDWAIIRLLGHNQAPRPAGSAFDFIGVPAGSTIFRVVDTPSPQGLILGIGAEDNLPGAVASYFESDPRINATGEWIRVRLKSVSGPGHVSLWGSDISGPVPFWASADGLSATDTAFVLNGDHADLNWAFTAPGQYTLTLEATAFQGPGATNPIFSGDVEYTIQAVPEPSSMALLGLAGLAGSRWFRRNRL
ncbi:MAG: choice-of-anchor M domain-containing protein [Gemmataceae bacterium]|nr:choice-of-anchor M domain-containing protein [Gemmataceae bacterium]